MNESTPKKGYWFKSLESVKRYGWLFIVIVFFGRYLEYILSLLSQFYMICGQDYPLHAANVIKLSYLKFKWLDVIKLYGSLAHTPYVLQLHYPPLAYLSSKLMYKYALDPLGAVVVANLGFMLLTVVALYFVVVKLTKNGFWGAVCAIALFSTYLVKCDVFDIGWRVPALCMSAVGFFVYMLFAVGRDNRWRWIVFGIVLGIAGLVHVLAFIPIFALAVVEIITQSRIKEPKPKTDIKFAFSRLAMTLFPAALVMSTFYLPLLFITPEHFGREIAGEAVIFWSKIKQTFISLHWDFAGIFFNNWSFVFLILFGLVILMFSSGLRKKMFYVIVILIISLAFGRTYNGSLYLIPYLAIIIPASIIGIWALARKLGKIVHILVGLLVAFISVKAFNQTIAVNECLQNGISGGFCADYGEILDLSFALKPYSKIPQDKIAFVDCRKNIGWNGDVAIVAMALARTEDAKSLWPFVRQIFNNDPQKDHLRRSDLICVIADRLEPGDTPICEQELVKSWGDGVIDKFTFSAKYKVGERWAVFYEKLPTPK